MVLFWDYEMNCWKEFKLLTCEDCSLNKQKNLFYLYISEIMYTVKKKKATMKTVTNSIAHLVQTVGDYLK